MKSPTGLEALLNEFLEIESVGASQYEEDCSEENVGAILQNISLNPLQLLGAGSERYVWLCVD